jgi:DNA-directed RNA polymerase specialized sigma24 family protein
MLRYLGNLFGWFCASRSSRRPAPPLLGLDIPFSDPAIEQDSQAEIARRLAAMPIMIRETYLLRTVDQMSIDQIAHRLAIPRREIRRNLGQAIGYLQRADPD